MPGIKIILNRADTGDEAVEKAIVRPLSLEGTHHEFAPGCS